jgi:RNase H-fold protein (predicted Holliday junction resolvase)
MTSMQAERLDGELGGKKDMLDATAAAFILQSFLDKLEKLGTPDTSDKNVSNV